MTSQELEQKLNQANEKVEKRVNTINKLCKALKVDVTTLLNEYSKTNKNASYLPSREAKEIVAKVVSRKPDRDENGDWNDDNYEFNNKVSQLEDNLGKLFEVERVAQGWQVKYDTQLNKENAPKIEVLWNFLTNWENDARDWYVQNSKYLVQTMNEFHTLAYDFLKNNGYFKLNYQGQREFAKSGSFDQFFSTNYHISKRYRYGYNDVDDWVREKHIDQLTISLSNIRFEKTKNEDDMGYSYDQNFGYSAHQGEYVLKSFDLEKLNKILAQEKQAKYEDLCNRISAVVGEIQDVSNLSIGNQRGELNGIVMGSKGSARVETIGAGGYNVGEIVNVRQGQVFHYRVLVHKIK